MDELISGLHKMDNRSYLMFLQHHTPQDIVPLRMHSNSWDLNTVISIVQSFLQH